LDPGAASPSEQIVVCAEIATHTKGMHAAMSTSTLLTPVGPTNAALRVECVGSVADAADCATWNALSGENPFRSWQWLDCWSRHYAVAGVEPMVLVVRDAQDRLIGVAPCCATRSRIWGRTIRFLGSGEVCSDYLGLLSRPEDAPSVAEAIGTWLTSNGDTWDRIELDGVAADDAAIARLVAGFQMRRHHVAMRSMPSAWAVELPERWDDYLPRLSQVRRDRVRQLTRRWLDSGRCVPRLAQSWSDVERAWPMLCELHQRRRKSLGEAGCFASPQFTAFHYEVVDRMYQAGRLRLHWVEFEGQAIAGEYALTGGDTIYVYQCGFDPDHSKMKPGWLNTIASMRLAIEQGYRRYDLLRGDEPYKQSWRAETRALLEVRVMGKSVAARLRHRLLRAAAGAGAWINQRRECSRLAAGFAPRVASDAAKLD
jgi:CelD/BcsL family acetyltransferase involved in cellulose biosynthesis